MFSATPLKEEYQRAKQHVYQEIKQRAKIRPLNESERKKISENIPPCISHIINELPIKSEKVNFNKLVMILVNYFQIAGWTFQDAYNQVQHFINNYPYSDTYTSPGERKKHWYYQWDYLKNNSEYSFDCSYVKGLGLPGNAFNCTTCKAIDENESISSVSEKILDYVRSDEDGDAQLFVHQLFRLDDGTAVFRLTGHQHRRRH